MKQKNCNFKKIEFGIQLILLICYLLANAFYYRRFHYISFFMFLIICLKNGYFLFKRKTVMIPKELRKEWKIMYPMYIISIAFVLASCLWIISSVVKEIDTIVLNIALLASICFVLILIICLFAGEVIQQIKERKFNLQKKFVHLYASVFQWCIVAIFIFFAVKTDIFYSTTRLRYYSIDVNMFSITETDGGFFPDSIPKEAKNVEYYYTPGGISDVNSSHINLKMTVGKDYLTHLIEIYEDAEYIKIAQDCSVLNKYNCKDYFDDTDLTEKIEEYLGKENCTVYFIYDWHGGFVIDYTTNEVKLFFCWNL